MSSFDTAFAAALFFMPSTAVNFSALPLPMGFVTNLPVVAERLILISFAMPHHNRVPGIRPHICGRGREQGLAIVS